jgi:hypothetical protein
VVTVGADLDRVEGRLAAGEFVVLVVWRRAEGLGAGEVAAGAGVSAPVAVHRLGGDACVVAGDRAAAPC